MSKLNLAYRTVLESEVPNLLPLLPDWVRDFFVQILDLETLSLRSVYAHAPHDEERLHALEETYLLGSNCEVIGVVGTKQVMRYKSVFGWMFGGVQRPMNELTDESVEQTIARLAGKDIRYVLHLNRLKATAVFYKIPKGISLQEHLEGMWEKERAELKK